MNQADKPPTKEELLEKAKQPAKEAMQLHPYYKGKIQTIPKCTIRGFEDFAIWYTPGVAAPCRDIEANPEQVWEHTNKANSIAVVSDGSRVLGLGNIGPDAAMPVMEGKALIFKYLGGVDAVPICLNTQDPENFIRATKLLQPSFGGINLEDISKPKCFNILNRLRTDMNIPVWHDDAQGTAAIILAGLLGALRFVGKEIDQVQIGMLGVGAANTTTAEILIEAGVPAGNIILCDRDGLLYKGREDMKEMKDAEHEKYDLAILTNAEQRTGDFGEALRDADVCISASAPKPGLIKTEWIKNMASDAIVFACANPLPEIWPWEAKEAGAKVIGTGRSDFANQINNSLGFPAIFRGALDVRATTITDEMCIAAAQALADIAEDRGLREDYVIPSMQEWELYPREATAVGMKAIEQGVARKEWEAEELLRHATKIIKRSIDITQSLMDNGFIPKAPI
ncbi:MAG: NADP-dependent malic enzyme [Candidatus Thorarchaeota archaeon]